MTDNTLFALPRVGRDGLGNRLFPWARAELFAERSGAVILAPRWAGLRIAPYLRGEADKRNYAHSFRATHHIRGIRKSAILMAARRIHELQLDINRMSWPAGGSPIVVEFSGLGGFFAPLRKQQSFLRTQLWNMTVADLRPPAGTYGSRFIAMHIRRGDLTRQGLTPEELKLVYQYTPMSWFVSMARRLRSNESLRSVPIVVLTDGSDEEVDEIMKVDGVVRHLKGAPITDMWVLSQASLLFASGFSTFSMWGSFLGRMPTIYAPGKLGQRLHVGSSGPVEIELAEGADIPEAALRSVPHPE